MAAGSIPKRSQVSNYELGVVIPLFDSKEGDDIVCWERPPKSYDDRGDQPWVSTGLSFPFSPPTPMSRFRVNLPYSTNWTGYKGICPHECRVGLCPSPIHYTSSSVPPSRDGH